MLAQSTIEQVKSYEDIVTIISDYVTLKKRGRNYIGLCPFHNEKTPSFTVNQEKQIWHCFGCHEGGNLISFIMKIDNLSYIEAIRAIAQRVGITIIEDARNNILTFEELEREAVQKILVDAKKFFQEQLTKDQAKQDYLKQRGLKKEIIRDFYLGYAPGDSNLLINYLSSKHEIDFIKKSGLLYQNKEEKLLSQFRNRIIFPIIDYRGRTLGFGGRTLTDNKNIPKYINSEEGVIFNKRQLLYGFYYAKNYIKKLGYCILMEGYMDVLTAHQYSFGNAVGSMGTALTIEQVKKIKRYTSKIIIALDNDVAGQKAIEKNIQILKRFDFIIYVIKLKEKDPAEELNKYGKDYFQNLIQTAMPAIEFIFRRTLQRYDFRNIENIPKIISEIIPFLKTEIDPIVRDHYIKEFSRFLKINPELLFVKLQKINYNGKKRQIVPSKERKDKYHRAEEVILYLCFISLDLRTEISHKLSINEFSNLDRGLLYEKIIKSSLLNSDLLQELGEEGKKQKISKILIENEQILNPSQYQQEMNECISTLKIFSIENTKKQLLEKISALEALSGKEAEIEDLMRDYNKLMMI